MNFSKIKICVLLSSIFLVNISLADSTNISYTSPELFPLPKELKPAVEFWIKIYSKYNTNEYVIHDSRRLSVVYEIVEFGSLNKVKMDLPQTRAQRNELRKKMKYYKSILLKLASRNTKFNELKSEERQIFEQFGKTTDRSVYRTAAYNIRVQKGQRNRFLGGLVLSGRYMPYIKEIFHKYNLPEELIMIPHVESSFNYRAYSSAGAAGIWQFTRGTGRRFLKISYEIDERLDPLLASEAAAKLLRDNYKTLGNWSIAITAYNHGTAGMKRAKKKLKTDDIATIVAKYRSRYFKFASRNFYCEFLAALHVSQHYRDYFGEIIFDPPLQFQEYELPHYIKCSSVAQYFNLDKSEIKKYNPSLRNPIFQGSKYLPKGYRLRFPLHVNPGELYAQIPANELYVAQKQSFWYRVRRGDTLSGIARRNRTSVFTLTALNNISNAHKIRIGERLQLPGKTKLEKVNQAVESVTAQVTPSEPMQKADPGKSEITESAPVKTVEKETIYANTEKNITSEIDLELGLIPDRVLLSAEVELVEGTNPQVGYIVVEPDETLGHYAKWLKIPTQKIRNWNYLAFNADISLGQKLKINFEKTTPEKFISARLEYHRAIEEDFFNNYKVTGTITHIIKSGENIWYLCNYVYNLPYRVLKSYNSDLSLNELNPGDLILIPEISEIKPGV